MMKNQQNSPFGVSTPPYKIFMSMCVENCTKIYEKIVCTGIYGENFSSYPPRTPRTPRTNSIPMSYDIGFLYGINGGYPRTPRTFALFTWRNEV